MKTLVVVTLSFSSCLWFFLSFSLCIVVFCDKKSAQVLCRPTERSVLIQFKKNLINGANRLSSWSGEECCSWSGVVCDNSTGHVHEIRLRGPDDELEEATNQKLGGILSPSLSNLSQLRHLDLSGNDFESISIPTFFGSFQNLRYLNLSNSKFIGKIPHQLGNLTQLQVLDLHSQFSDLYSESLSCIENLKRLQHLDMGGANLTDASDWFQVISTLPSLQELSFSSCGLTQIPSQPTRVSFTTSITILDLSYNIFDSLFPSWIFNLHNLVSLDLTSCFINAQSPETHVGFDSMHSLRTLRVSTTNFLNSSSILDGLSRLSDLRVLDLSTCNLSDPILRNLQNLSRIVHLDLSNNQIVEDIPKSLNNLCNLTTLDLQSNNFSGSVSELLEGFCECESPKLELLALRGNYLVGRLPEKLGRLRNLASIDIAYNKLTGVIPYSIGSLSFLNTLQLNINMLEGSIPNSVGDLTSLNFLDLSYNQLNGSLPASIGQLGQLSFLTLHHNLLTGFLTEDHFANLSALKTLWVGDNKLVFKLSVNNWVPPFQLGVLRIGSCSVGPLFPSWVQSQSNLAELDLSNANISDTIPSWIWSTLSSVTYFNLSHNRFLGKLGDASFLTQGAVLDLSNNRFSGPLPRTFNKPNLDFIDLSNNNLSGSLDLFLCSSIQEPRLLRVLNLANNNISGVISDCWVNWESLVILNLEKNKLSGRLPQSLGKLPSLQSLDIGNNKLSGALATSLLNSKSLQILELAENELTGKIPTSIGREGTSLKILSLRSNKLQGPIPDEICRFNSIQILDLADNNLSGHVPTCFTNFSVISGKQRSSPIVLYDALFQNQVLGSAFLVTKGRVSQYDTILFLVTTIDLSDNQFYGSIPDELVELVGLRYLNLSNNGLSGRIPNTFTEMRQLESLDLSVNHLDGKIPSSLSTLTSLNFLNVSYNNLTGRIPTGPQLQTFNESSFIGNALCGAPLAACILNGDDPGRANEVDDESNGIDWILILSTCVGFFVGFWIIIVPLMVSKRWKTDYYHFLDKTGIALRDFLLVIIPCFKQQEPLQETHVSSEQVQRFDFSQYVYDPKGMKHNASSSQASSSTGPV